MKNHLTGQISCDQKERDFQFAEVRSNRSLLEDDQNLDFSKMMAKNEGIFIWPSI